MISWAERYGSYWRAAGWIRGGFVVLAVASAVLFFRYGAAAAPDPQAEEPGVLVTSVSADTPAARAGIKRGDIVLEIDGQPADDVMELHKYVLGKQTGDQVRLKVQHGDEIRTLEIALGDREGTPYLGITPFLERPWGLSVAATAAGGEGPITLAAPWAGDATGALTEVLSVAAAPALPMLEGGEPFSATMALRGGHRHELGFAVEPGEAFTGTMSFAAGGGPAVRLFASEVPVGGLAADSPAAEAGLAAGDIITAVNGKALESPLELWRAIEAAKPGDALALTVRDGDGEERAVSVTLGEHPQQPGEAYLGLEDGMRHWAMPALGLMRHFAIGGFDGESMPALQDWVPFQI